MYTPYSESMMESVKKVEATRAARMATEPRRLTAEEKERLQEYMDGFSPCAVVTAGGDTFFLSHTAPLKSDMEDISKGDVNDFTWGNIEYGKRYFEDGFLVTGHTPTVLFGKEYRGKIYKANGHIDIDCGAFFTGTLGCLCLDTMEEFYVHDTNKK